MPSDALITGVACSGSSASDSDPYKMQSRAVLFFFAYVCIKLALYLRSREIHRLYGQALVSVS
ncbi:hypothetical protein FA95DRAFT_1556086 [Auriscalpium vulgare]|uniref:Uncharacterized protein n=1 Tax=Auriscalpium vulgare TaxID=40419 RepID=A0ACB8S247_9AGAM|nr:hypothetical protein FA95DRAFT_1556086 [Auriscalpium vulgare]